MKLYIVSNSEDGKKSIGGIYYLITENGEVLYSHWCSSMGYAKGDLIDNRPERIKKCKEEYGEYQVLFLGEDDMTFEKLQELNEKFGEE